MTLDETLTLMTGNARRVLRDAAEYIAEHGHHKGSLYGPNGTVCAAGAMDRVRNGDIVAYYKAVELLDSHLGQSGWTNGGCSSIPYWNDHPSTTAEDVILTLKRLGNEVDTWDKPA